MDTNTLDGWIQNGSHAWRFESPNVFFSRTVGMVHKQDLENTFLHLAQKIAEVGPIFWIADVSRMEGMESRARSIVNVPGYKHNPADLLGFAIIGASFHKRVLVQLGIKATRLLRGDATATNVRFFAHENEAREWVESIRVSSPGR